MSSYVDSENSYGANIRSNFTVEGILVGDEWRLVKLVFDGETVIDRTDELIAEESD